MRPPAEQRQMKVMFDVHQYDLSEGEKARLAGTLDSLARIVQHFPYADLHIMVEGNARSNDVSVKLSLMLPGTPLIINDHDVVLTAAFERCLTALIDKVEGYKATMAGEGERAKLQKGTAHELLPTRNLDLGAVERAVAAGDYPAFRLAMLPFEEPVQDMAGRWVQRFPEYEARIGRDVKMSDVTEEIFLTAFDQYADRPEGLQLSEWLANLIDPSVKTLMTRTAEEMENINMTRSAMNATQPIGRG